MMVGHLTADQIGKTFTIREAESETSTPDWVLRGRLVGFQHFTRQATGEVVSLVTLLVGPAATAVTIELTPNAEIG